MGNLVFNSTTRWSIVSLITFMSYVLFIQPLASPAFADTKNQIEATQHTGAQQGGAQQEEAQQEEAQQGGATSKSTTGISALDKERVTSTVKSGTKRSDAPRQGLNKDVTSKKATSTASSQKDILSPPSPSLTNAEPIDSSVAQRFGSFLGIFGLIGLAWLLSEHRKSVSWRLVGIGVGLQLFFAVFILLTPIGRPIFDVATGIFTKLMGFTDAGSRMIFSAYDSLGDSLLKTLAFGVLPTIIFFSSLMAVLYHLGVMQRIVNAMAWLMQRTMRTSGSETLSAAANIFVGQTEAPLMIKPYVKTMTHSELMAVMVGGFATVAGGVMAIYVMLLAPIFPDIAGHLMAASVMSAPAALVIAKILYPETEESHTKGTVQVKQESMDANIIDAAARGAGEGLTLLLNVGAMLLAFVALIAMINYGLGLPSYIQHHVALESLWSSLQVAGADLSTSEMVSCAPDTVSYDASAACITTLNTIAEELHVPTASTWGVLSLEGISGYLFAPIAFLIGIPWSEITHVGQLLGTKIVLNEFIAYQQLAEMVKQGHLSPRSVMITTYALCGFANFGSIAIQIGGIGGLAPERRADIARLGIKAMIGGTLAALMTGAVAGVML